MEVEILYDGVREMREAFTLHLKPDENMVAEIQVLSEHFIQFAHLIKIWVCRLKPESTAHSQHSIILP